MCIVRVLEHPHPRVVASPAEGVAEAINRVTSTNKGPTARPYPSPGYHPGLHRPIQSPGLKARYNLLDRFTLNPCIGPGLQPSRFYLDPFTGRCPMLGYVHAFGDRVFGDFQTKKPPVV